jgi:hypothetical protein
MPNIEQSLKMILEGTFLDDISNRLYLHECEYGKYLTEFASNSSYEHVKTKIHELEKLLSHNERLKQEVKTKHWKFSNPEAELQKLDKQAETLNYWLDRTKDDEVLKDHY